MALVVVPGSLVCVVIEAVTSWAMCPRIVAEPVMRHNGCGKAETIGYEERACRTRRPATRRAASGRAGRPVRPLDDADRRILGELVRDARTSIRTLAERIHVSRANAYARVDRLLADGVITGFSARIAPERAGLGTSAYVSLSIEQNSWREVSARLRELPFVEHAAMLGADFDVLVLVRAPDNAALREVVLEQIQGVPGIKADAHVAGVRRVRGPRRRLVLTPRAPEPPGPGQLTLFRPLGSCPADLR